jgi:hypothetical protein
MADSSPPDPSTRSGTGDDLQRLPPNPLGGLGSARLNKLNFTLTAQP